MPDSDIGFVVGLRAEATLLRGLNRPVAIGGGGFDGAMRAAEQLIASGVKRIVSFGLAGGLDPALKPGALLVPARVVVDASAHDCDPGLIAWLGKGDHRALFGGRAVLASQSEKAAAFAITTAAAIDLESGAVALAALRAGAAFAVLRAVCDPARRDLPPAALIALDSQGAIGGARIARSVLGAPGQIGGLLALAWDAAGARKALRRRVDQIARSAANG